MKLHTVTIAVLLGATALAVHAASAPDLSHAIDPGEWAYVVDPQVQIGGLQIPSKTIHDKACVTQKKLDTNKDWFVHSRQKQCTFESVKYQGHVLTYTEKCAMGGGHMTMHGRMTIDSRTAYHMTVDTTGSMGGQKLQGHAKITAHRTGDCGGTKP